ncbi:hypothetical protein K469DRAFT_687780 [Zopfia rhizophila CBS 207.26]|uniref:DUF3597 domain-containing protein n=1 Tax=Zopfia rhizophila CBS 207.26 TaxID=1314779 RepID=A0A6A6E329_9PEZI|nr:hypothetical protein K469DRAFT_687780 [Zopfia rhizophila CBS 207.26]
MTYGYHSKLSSRGVDTITDSGRELLEEIGKIRNRRDEIERPIFFIAHSFGSIILADSLIHASQVSRDDHPAIVALYPATYGMLLFSIPFKGMIIDDVLSMLERGTNILEDEKEKRWVRNGPPFTPVESKSALLELPDSIEQKIKLDTDHSTIVKFDSKYGRGSTSARNKLQQFQKDAPSVVENRFRILRMTNTKSRPEELAAEKARKGVKLRWQESVVGLLKLIGLDSSMTSRKQLAEQLDINADPPGSANQNMALHNAIIQVLSMNSGMITVDI